MEKIVKKFNEYLNEDNIYQTGIDPNSVKFLKPMLSKFKEKLLGDWEFKGYVINYHVEDTGKWAQITIVDDPPTKLNVLVGNLSTDPFGKRAKEKKFNIEDFDEIINYIS